MTAPVRATASTVTLATDDASWLAPVAALSLIAMGRGVQIANGTFHPDAIFWLAVTTALAVVATIARRPAGFARFDRFVVPIIALGGLGIHTAQLFSAPPGIYAHLDADATSLFTRAIAVLAVLGCLLVVGTPRRIMMLLVGALVLVHFEAGALIIRHAPRPHIDVDVFHHDAIAALLAGHNPYRITFRDIYGPSAYYGPGLSVNGRLLFGFPYPPLSLLLTVPGQFLGGDQRFAMLGAVELAAVLMAFARPKGFGPAAAALYLTTPRGFFVIEQSWTEPLIVLGLAVTVFAACRHSRLVPWLFGAFVALKQYLIFALPAGLLLVTPRPDFRRAVTFATKAAVVGLVTVVPFVAWGPRPFVTSVITLQFYQPFREDSLSFLAWWVRQGHPYPPTLVPFAAASIMALLATWRFPRTAAGFAGTVAVTFLAFFAFNKQAFCNYYFFTIGAFAVTLAAWRPPDQP